MRDILRAYRSISLVGNVKNAGKTTALNAFIGASLHNTLGLTSIGLDGEELDLVSSLPKPRILIPQGALVAGAKDCLAESPLDYEVLERTGVFTGLGEVLIVRAKKAGTALVGGPSTLADAKRIVARLQALGAGRVFVDGAFGRLSHAGLCEAMVYIVGAHQSPDMNKVVRQAGTAIRRFTLKQAASELLFLDKVEQPGFLDVDLRFHPLPFESVIGHEDALLSQVPPDAPWLFLPGALGAAFARAFVQSRKAHACGLVIRDAAKLVADGRALEQLFALDRPTMVIKELNPVAVVLNPFSPAGWRFDSRAFKEAMQQVTDLPLINVLEDAL